MRKSSMRCRRSSAASREIQPRSIATINAMTPKPEPPMVTGSSSLRSRVLSRSGARLVVGSALSQKNRKVRRCTASSNSSFGSLARAAGLGALAAGAMAVPRVLALEDLSVFGTWGLLSWWRWALLRARLLLVHDPSRYPKVSRPCFCQGQEGKENAFCALMLRRETEGASHEPD